MAGVRIRPRNGRVLDGTSRSPTEGNAADMSGSAAAAEAWRAMPARPLLSRQREFCSRLSLSRISTCCLPPLRGLFTHAPFRGLRAARLPPAGFFGPFGAIRATNPGIAHTPLQALLASGFPYPAAFRRDIKGAALGWIPGSQFILAGRSMPAPPKIRSKNRTQVPLAIDFEIEFHYDLHGVFMRGRERWLNTGKRRVFPANGALKRK